MYRKHITNIPKVAALLMLNFNVWIVECQDNIPPEFNFCPSDLTFDTLPAASLGTNIPISWDEPTYDDQGGTVQLNETHSSGDEFIVGEQTLVIYTLTDATGNFATCAFVVTLLISGSSPLVDTVPPTVIKCPGDVTETVELGQPSVQVSWIEPVALDASEPPSVTVSRSRNPGDFFAAGETDVSYTFTDSSSNSATCSFTVVVQTLDSTPPVIDNCPNNPSITVELGAVDGFVTWIQPIATDLSGIANLETRTHAPGSSFPVGQTTVIYVFGDSSGNSAVCQFVVIVNTEDTTPPNIIGCPDTIFETVDFGTAGTVITWLEPTSFDISGTDALVSRSHLPGSEFSEGNTFVQYIFGDASGNEAICRFLVQIGTVDTEPPVISGCPPDQNLVVELGTTSRQAFWIVPTATDLSGSVAITTESHQSGDSFFLGMTPVMYAFSDPSGNMDVCTFVITVSTDHMSTDGIPCPTRAITTVAQGNLTLVEWRTPIIHITNSGKIIEMEQKSPLGSGLRFPIGATEVVYSADEALCRFWVIVEEEIENTTDVTPPTVYDCPKGPLIYAIRRDQISIEPDWKEPFAIDDSGLPVVSHSSHSSGDPLEVGDTKVTFNFTDFNDNLEQCIFTITVIDIDDIVPPPEISFCPTSIIYNLDISVDEISIKWDEPMIDNANFVMQTHFPGDFFKIGTTQVTYTAVNSAGEEAVCTFMVDVRDVFPPIVSLCPSGRSVRACRGTTTVVWLEPSANDNSGFQVDQIQSHFPRVSLFKEGTTTVNYTFSDIFGNTVVCSFNVTVHRNSCQCFTREELYLYIYIILGLLIFVFVILTAVNIFIYKTSRSTDDNDENDLSLHELTST